MVVGKFEKVSLKQYLESVDSISVEEATNIYNDIKLV